MTLAEIHMILVENRDLIAQTWNFFVTVHLALLGLVFLAEREGTAKVIRALLVPAYLAFMYINYRAQLDNYAYTTKILELAQNIEQVNGTEDTALSVIFDTGWITQYLSTIYSIAAAFGVSVISLGLFGRHRHANKQSAAQSESQPDAN